jgi:hypothetical protein
VLSACDFEKKNLSRADGRDPRSAKHNPLIVPYHRIHIQPLLQLPHFNVTFMDRAAPILGFHQINKCQQPANLSKNEQSLLCQKGPCRVRKAQDSPP